jgi:aspartokinase
MRPRALHDAREYDTVVASGEQVTAGLLAIALQEIGINARSWLGWQIPIHTMECIPRPASSTSIARKSSAVSGSNKSRW